MPQILLLIPVLSNCFKIALPNTRLTLEISRSLQTLRHLLQCRLELLGSPDGFIMCGLKMLLFSTIGKYSLSTWILMEMPQVSMKSRIGTPSTSILSMHALASYQTTVIARSITSMMKCIQPWSLRSSIYSVQ